jgi:hypothetical protein
MKTFIFSLAALAAFSGAASADTRDLRLERRWDAHGQQYFVYVREPQVATTVALHRVGRGIGEDRYDRHDGAYVVKSKRPIRHERRFNAQGESFFLYAPANSGPAY